MEEAAVSLDDFVGLHVLSARVGVRVGLDVALVEQAMERFFARYMAKIEQHLVPKAAVQQVQHCVLDTADVEIDTAHITGLAGPHPVSLVGRINESRVI